MEVDEADAQGGAPKMAPAAPTAANTYTIRPNFKHKFRPVVVKELIHRILMDTLNEKQYSSEEAKTWTREISDTIKSKLKELGLDRYKYVIQVMIGEQRGEGVKLPSFYDSYAKKNVFLSVTADKSWEAWLKAIANVNVTDGYRMGCRCFWDSDTDNYAQDIFMNETLFCVAAAFGVYYY